MLLFDENLSLHLVSLLADIYPGSTHSYFAGLVGAADPDVRRYAAANNLTIVSRDRDMRNLSHYYGHPPKVIWLCVGNCSTARVETLLRGRHADVLAFLADPVLPLLTLV